MADAEFVYVPNPFTGRTEVTRVTEDRPSPESGRLAEALAVLADPDAEVPPGTMWEPTPSPDARRAKWLGDVDLALEQRAITTRESATLLETFGRLGRAQGWFGADGEQELRALLRMRLGSRGQEAVPSESTPRAQPASAKEWPGTTPGPRVIEYGAAIPSARIGGRG